jgi:hypothetical protein
MFSKIMENPELMNYRPITHLSCIYGLFEKVLHERLKKRGKGK